eukprot:CAMPEP_0117429054 /NCGR_PEP_ID=MMETSP0758-20121206/8629_1 /TAXON_ID=63605 /ORGANISM="Percolomonas cosmopolitus, Strain AE-1 (ATCC 50343)" /LENGTH=210 /DNA_ID=CAMNT_0005215761 /DNA_START=492 /DNA_END=1121 /DNA_ORIENTATION=-
MTESECPPMYFVHECTTISAPNANGLWKYGDMNVLSTTTLALNLCAILHAPSISVNFSVGFVGVSIHTNFVLFSTNAFSYASKSVVSTNVNSIPNFAAMVLKYLCVPPYMSSHATTWSPAFSVCNIVAVAPNPDENISPYFAPSSAAKQSSSAFLVGFDVLEYSYAPGYSFPGDFCANVDDIDIGVINAPECGSGFCPACIASVPKFLNV